MSSWRARTACGASWGRCSRRRADAVRFVDFLKTTVLLSAAAATALALVTVLSASGRADDALVVFLAGWWLLAAVIAPQGPAIAAGFAVIWALSWRRQEAAVAAIEDRDGVQFYVERTSPFRPIQLVRVPGFRKVAPPS